MSTCLFCRRFARNRDVLVRFKHQDTHWSMQKKKHQPAQKALKHFDDFYEKVFTRNWPSIRKGLLANSKYVAVVNNYSNVEKTIGQLENLGALNMRTLFQLEKERNKESYHTREREQFIEKIKKSEAEEAPTPVEEKPGDKYQFSLAASLKEAEYDDSRFIDSRLGLSAPALQEFVPVTKLKGREDWISESDHYNYYENGMKRNVDIQKEDDIHFPENLNVYCFEEDNFSDFPPPRQGDTGVYDYYLLDGGSVLPVLALGIKPGDKILDMCAAPGGKSVIALQTLYPEHVTCNDISKSRTDRVYNVLEQYFYDLEKRWIQTNRVQVTQIDGRNIQEGEFDCVLVDVPCTTDRHSLRENDNNIFKPSRNKERLKLPELQSSLLKNALKLVKKGGSVVYSTCSLSPIQNDGVVNMALGQLWEETRIEMLIKDLSPALFQTKRVYKFARPNVLKYGHLVVPSVSQNYGPTYFCKLVRVN